MPEVNLELIQAMLQRVLDVQGKHTQDFVEVKQRLSSVELGVAGIRREIALDAENVAHVRHDLDRLGQRIDRIERRLELTDL